MYRLLLSALLGIVASAASATDWTTPAEAAHFRTTPSHADTLAYLARLQQAAPGMIRLITFGTTPEGRPMTAVIASGDGTFDPAAARKAGKPVVLLQAGIHPGEIEGKDAGLMLLRDIAVTGKAPHLLDHVVLVYIPVFSVDGHENASPYHRINQNGPDSMGFRGQSQYLNLNRDYVKADAPEMRAWLKLWQRWLPDFLVDVHTTDGADYQYDLTWYTEDPHKLDPALSAWQRDALVSHALPAYEKRGHAQTLRAEGYQLDDPKWADKPFEGHLMLRDFTLHAVPREVTLPAGSVIVPLDQRTANVAIELLEPQAPDSLLRWGCLDAVFEAKEYGEPRVVERLAREMLAKDPALNAAFEQKLHDDPAFAADSRARLAFFFERSPWHAAQHVGAYPVLRLDAAQLRHLSAPVQSAGSHGTPDL